VESTTGTLDLQGTRYRITRGNVSFIDPAGIDPIVDLQAETEIRNYRVILTITGRASDPRLDMRSDPALPQLEIISLIAGGRTREELAGGGNAAAAPTSEELFQSASATILTDLLAERVGTRFGLLNRVRIDPFLVGAESDPVARITISERITSNLEITYAQDLSSNRQQIILIEYLLDDGTSFIASRDETGAVGLDLQFRKRFR
jgi:autotransporter translocation and assembly factor TamB